MTGRGIYLGDLPSDIYVSMIVAFFIGALVYLVPNYDRMVYSQTEPVEYSEAQHDIGYIGYPAGDDVPELVSREEIIKENHSYTLVVDAETIKPLHLYLGLSKDTMTESAFVRFMSRDENKRAMGQLFSVELENGDTMIVLLDDNAVKLPRSGLVKLPIGRTKKLLWSDVKEYLTDKYDFSKDELACYIDMARGWRKSDMAERIETIRLLTGWVTIIIVGFGVYFLVKRIECKEASAFFRRGKR